MYKRFWIICLVIGAALLVLSVVGLSSLGVHERSLRAERQNQFIAVAEQIRYDIKTKLDEFLQAEQQRPYTDYQYAYVPETTNQADALVRSPLADSLSHGLAFGHFQIDAAGNISTPYARIDTAREPLDPALTAYIGTLETRVLEALKGRNNMRIRRDETAVSDASLRGNEYQAFEGVSFDSAPASVRSEAPAQRQIQQAAAPKEMQTRAGSRYPIDSLQESQRTQTMAQPRDTVVRNAPMFGVAPVTGSQDDSAAQEAVLQNVAAAPAPVKGGTAAFKTEASPAETIPPAESIDEKFVFFDKTPSTVQIRIEPFVPLTVSNDATMQMIFSDQIFLVRHVQIEGVHLLQGFRLNEAELAEQVQESARRLLREGMEAELARSERPDAAHSAILDFGFGELVLNLLELNPGWIAAQVARLNTAMTAILIVVWLAVALAMLALWRNLHEQIKLARKKDDFISAVSHELRTPLTSIRMYSEMLEKDWVKDDAKRREYYGTMRQESERLTRLIENVLDFSRLQRGKKQFEFIIGDVNDNIRDVAEMMRPCAERAGFAIETEFSPIEPFAFDRDAVMQIVINLIDNALKYAKEAVDKRILIRTYPDDGAVIIEVEDHGPGVPKSHQKRIFEAFYRCDDESTRQAAGTGLGLALVKRFAEAHHGLVEILNAKPSGALFRVRIAR